MRYQYLRLCKILSSTFSKQLQFSSAYYSTGCGIRGSRLNQSTSLGYRNTLRINQSIFLRNMASYEKVLQGKYPAKEHAKKVAEWIVENGGDAKGMLYLEGQKSKMNEDNDQEAPFRQRRYFYYLTGCNLPNCYVTYDMSKQHLTLFIPPVDPEDVMWSGLPLTVDEAIQKYDVDSVQTTPELNSHLASPNTPKSTIYAIPHQISDQTTFLPFETKALEVLKTAIETCRIYKDAYEVALIKKANSISRAAHLAVIAAAKSATNERELQAVFLKSCIERGAKEQSYDGIFASGTASATLHYVKNDQPLQGKLNVLVDAGAELDCYASDITRVFPLNGTFTEESRAIYNIVLKMQVECLALIKAGMKWDDVHEHAHRVAIAGLLELGILKGSPEELFEKRISVAFFPHGLGHYMGMDTHDTGGKANYSDKDSMFRYLRVRGTVPAGAVITVEPGVYFCRFIIEPFLKDPEKSKYIDATVMEKYWDVGGVRIEDDVLVTEGGYENLTDVPKKAEEIEQIVLSGAVPA